MSNSETKQGYIVSKLSGTPDRFWCGKGLAWSHDLADAKVVTPVNLRDEQEEAELHGPGEGRRLDFQEA